MKKLYTIFSVLACLLGTPSAFSFNIDQQCFDDEYIINEQHSNLPSLKFVFKVHPNQIHVEEDKISLDMNGMIYPIEKLYVESGQIFAEGLMGISPLNEDQFIIFVTCPTCGKEFLIGQGHTCEKK